MRRARDGGLVPIAAVALLAAAGACGQDPQKPEAPAEAAERPVRSEYWVDLKGLRETDVWDLVERAWVGRFVAGVLRRQVGLSVNEIDSVLTVAPDPAQEVGVRVLSCRGPVTLPAEEGATFAARRLREIQGKAALQEGENTLYALVEPHVMVWGPRQFVEPVLRGDSELWKPNPDLVEGTSKETVLAYGTWDVPPGEIFEPVEGMPPWFTDEDPPTSFLLRLVRTQDGDVVASLRARFERGREGPELFEETFEKLRTSPPATWPAPTVTAWKALMGHGTVHRDGRDLIVTCDLGEEGRRTESLLQVGLSFSSGPK